MKSAFRALALGTLLLLPISAAFAQAPSVTAISDVTLNAGGTMTVNVVATDVNGDPITLTSSLPTFGTLNGPTTGTGIVITTLTLAPSSTDVGTYTGSVTATAGGQTDVEEFMITINATGTNQTPVVTAPALQTVTEGQPVTFTVTASDSEAIQFFSASGLPTGANFTTNVGNTSGTFSWTPSTSQSGEYDVIFTASNESGAGSASTHFVVVDSSANQCPVITLSQSTLTVVEGQHFAFNVTVSDPDGGNVDLSASGVPTGATFTDNNNNVGTLDWTPGSTQAGTYAVTFTANDNEGCTQNATLTITVNEGTGGNDCPTITAPATQTVNEGQGLNFNVTTSDPDGDTVTISASGVPSGATFSTSTGAFSWTPNSTQSGTYTVTFTANDNHGCTQTATTVITVNNVSQGGTVDATATMLGKFNTHKKFVCFKIRPVSGSFDPRDVTVSSIVLEFGGNEVHSLSGKTKIAFDCDDEDEEDCDCEDEDHDGDTDHDGDCEHDEDGDDDCVATHVRACFSMSSLREFFGDADFEDDLANATITGQLSTGQTFVATMDASRFASHGNQGDHGKNRMHLKAFPNPLNPKTQVSFTLAQAGRVRIFIYDLKGRLVKTLLDENRTAGENAVVWDGSDSRNAKVASGVYFFRIQAPQGQEVMRLTVLK